MLAMREMEPIQDHERLDSDALADRLEFGRKKRRFAYLAWLCFGSHYLYLGRPVVQALFWLTLGGLLFWWIADFFRLATLVERRNLRAARSAVRAWEARHFAPQVAMPWPMPTQPSAPVQIEPEPYLADVAVSEAPALVSPPGRIRKGAVLALAAALLAVFGTALFAPREFYPRNFSDPSFRTVRQVHAREAPSIASPIRARIDAGVVLTGTIEEVSAKGPSKWLRVTRGSHSDRYVALQNLKEY